MFSNHPLSTRLSPTPHLPSPITTQPTPPTDVDHTDTPSPPKSEYEHPIRISLRHTKPPAHLYDYICNLVSFSNLPNVSQVFLSKQAQWYEPRSYKGAVKDPSRQLAMQKELDALALN